MHSSNCWRGKVELTGGELQKGPNQLKALPVWQVGLKPAAVSWQPFTETGRQPCHNYAGPADVPQTLAVTDYMAPRPRYITAANLEPSR